MNQDLKWFLETFLEYSDGKYIGSGADGEKMYDLITCAERLLKEVKNGEK